MSDDALHEVIRTGAPEAAPEPGDEGGDEQLRSRLGEELDRLIERLQHDEHTHRVDDDVEDCVEQRRLRQLLLRALDAQRHEAVDRAGGDARDREDDDGEEDVGEQARQRLDDLVGVVVRQPVDHVRFGADDEDRAGRRLLHLLQDGFS